MTGKEPEEIQTDEVKSEIIELDDIEALKQALAEEKEKADDYLANWQRAQADFINYKKRTEQEKAEIGERANAMLLLLLLPVLDDLERALSSMPDEPAELSWAGGIHLIKRKFRAILEAQGLSQIKAIGEPFDPNLHEAAIVSKGKAGIVIDELQKGYKFRDKVIRPARVSVGSGEEDTKEE